MRQYRYQDKVFEFEGCVSVEVENRWCKPWRIIRKYIDLFPYVWEKAENASGVRLTFTTDSSSANHQIDLEVIYQSEKIIINKRFNINIGYYF